MVRTSKSRRRFMSRFEADMATRDLRQAKSSDVSDFTKRHIEKALADAAKRGGRQ
ncbi:hypothetical protein ACFOYU_11450 [Microvirga sp. GCM10011540]|uniref:hypothetical protein n=1 Tax=Microvirga sp. GCM10011540 TaxID=3317338 RepID=UPI0036159D7A